jgi:predicted metal-binding protein
VQLITFDVFKYLVKRIQCGNCSPLRIVYEKFERLNKIINLNYYYFYWCHLTEEAAYNARTVQSNLTKYPAMKTYDGVEV